MTLIQRFSSALTLNIRFHMLCLDGVFLTAQGRSCFPLLKPSTAAELDALINRIKDRVGRDLERAGMLPRDMNNRYRYCHIDALGNDLLTDQID